jgi:ankyrin repeat protein
MPRAALRFFLCSAFAVSAGNARARSADAPPGRREPTSRPSLPFSFPEGQESLVVPLRRAHLRLCAKTIVNGDEVGYFRIDTGSSVTVIAGRVADRLHLRSVGKRNVNTPNGRKSLGVTLVTRLDIGHASVNNHPLLIDPGLDDGAVCGAIGMDVIGRGPFTLNFRTATLTLLNPARFNPPEKTTAQVLRPLDETPVVSASVEGRDGWFQVDTGLNTGFWLSRSFSDLHPDLVAGRPRIKEVPPWGEPADLYGTWWASFEYLGKKSAPAYGYFQVGKSGLANLAGLIGVGALVDAKVTVDMASHRLWVEWPEPEPLDPLLKRLGESGSADVDGVSPLLYATLVSRSDAVKALLDRGAVADEPDLGGITPLMVAGGRGDAESAKVLIAHGARLDTRSKLDGYTPLVFAAQYGRTDLVAILLDANADIDLPTESGRTPLFLAADADRVDSLRLLLDRGAQVNKALPTGETPLIAACRNGSEKCVSLLLAYHADANVVGERGTPLIYASWSGSTECVRALLDRGASVNRATAGGVTPLMAAASVPRNLSCVRCLLEAGADPKVKDNEGLSAFDYAVSDSSAETIKLLASSPTGVTGGK